MHKKPKPKSTGPSSI